MLTVQDHREPQVQSSVADPVRNLVNLSQILRHHKAFQALSFHSFYVTGISSMQEHFLNLCNSGTSSPTLESFLLEYFSRENQGLGLSVRLERGGSVSRGNSNGGRRVGAAFLTGAARGLGAS